MIVERGSRYRQVKVQLEEDGTQTLAFTYNDSMKKIIVVLVLLLAVLFILANGAELQEILNVMAHGNLLFLGLALIIQIGWLLNMSAFYKSVYRSLGMEEKLAILLRLSMAANFLTVVAPSGGLSAIAVFVADARQRGRSSARALVACVLYVWFEYIGTLAALAIGLSILANRGKLHWSEITAAGLVLIAVLGISLALFLGARSTDALCTLLSWLAHRANILMHPFLHRNWIENQKVCAFSTELSEGINALHGNPRWVFKPLLFTLLGKSLLFGVLLACFLAFKLSADPGTIIAGLSIANLFLIVSPTPAGLGIVEGILPFVLNGLGVALEDATVATLAYRGFSFWLPFMVGLIAIRQIGQVRKKARRPLHPVVPSPEVPRSISQAAVLPNKDTR